MKGFAAVVVLQGVLLLGASCGLPRNTGASAPSRANAEVPVQAALTDAYAPAELPDESRETKSSPESSLESQVNDAIKKCNADNEYVDGVYICQDYAFDFHKICQAKGFECRTAGGACGKASDEFPHRFNMVKIDGLWYLADPTNSNALIKPGFPDFNQPPPQALCKAFGDRPLQSDGGCDCKLGSNSGRPITSVTQAEGCAESITSHFSPELFDQD